MVATTQHSPSRVTFALYVSNTKSLGKKKRRAGTAAECSEALVGPARYYSRSTVSERLRLHGRSPSPEDTIARTGDG